MGNGGLAISVQEHAIIGSVRRHHAIDFRLM